MGESNDGIIIREEIPNESQIADRETFSNGSLILSKRIPRLVERILTEG